MPFRLLIVSILFFLFRSTAPATTIIDFEGFDDGTSLTNQVSGLNFSNTVILTAGVSLNQFEFPPLSGANVASDNGGPITIVFDNPVSSFAGYFTYLEPLSIAAFDSANTQVDSANSQFSNNLALSGDPGSTPNEFIQVSFAGGISSVSIAGDPSGGSFTLDDVTLLNASFSSVPEPSNTVTVLSVLILLVLYLPPLSRRRAPLRYDTGD